MKFPPAPPPDRFDRIAEEEAREAFHDWDERFAEAQGQPAEPPTPEEPDEPELVSSYTRASLLRRETLEESIDHQMDALLAERARTLSLQAQAKAKEDAENEAINALLETITR